MSVVRIVCASYLAMFIYALLLTTVTTLEFGHLLPAFLQLLLCAIAFAVGYSAKGPKSADSVLNKAAPLKGKPWPLSRCLVLGLGILVASYLSVGYYTGMSPAEVIAHVRAGDSLYGEYQNYNKELFNAGGTGLSPWFALLVFRMATMLSALFSILPRGGRILPREWGMLGCVVLAQAYSGLARGTGLEFFQLGLALLIAVLMRSVPRRASVRRNLMIAISGIGLAVLYSSLLAARGVTTPSLGSGNDVRFAESWISALLGPGMVQFLLMFFDYFGFGFHYVATFWSNIWSSSAGNVVAGVIPGGFYSQGLDPLVMMHEYIELGPRWQPDSLRIFSSLGLTGLLLVCLLLGYMASKVEMQPTLTASVLRYFIIMQMISLPIGNFVWVDRSSLVVALGVVGIELLRTWGVVPPTFREFFGAGGSGRISRRALSTRTRPADRPPVHH